MIEPKVGQVWEHNDSKNKEIILKIEHKWVHTDKCARFQEKFVEYFTLNKEETLKHLKEQQEQIQQQLEELSKPVIVKHKFEVIVYAPEDFGSSRIYAILEDAIATRWEHGDITNYSVDVIKE